jgi:hypothetical protein
MAAMAESPPTEKLEWVVKPIQMQPSRAWIVLLAAILAGVLGTYRYGGIVGLVGFSVIMLATGDYWLGVRYTLTEQGAARRCGLSVTVMQWEDVRRVEVGSESVLLSPLERAGRMDAFRGVRLPLDEANQGPVLEWIRRHVGDRLNVSHG